MPNEVIILAIISAVSVIVGGLIVKLFELEYESRKKLEERYLSNAQKHSGDVYAPLYSKLEFFENNWTKSKTSNDFQNFKKEITELKNFKKDLEEKGLSAFLTPEIEKSFDHLLEFVSKSQGASKTRYGMITQYKIFGQEKSFYQMIPKMINFFRYSILILNFFRHISWTRISGFLDFDFKIIVDSAPLNSEDFDNQLSKFLIDLKKKIKGITLGTSVL